MLAETKETNRLERWKKNRVREKEWFRKDKDGRKEEISSRE